MGMRPGSKGHRFEYPLSFLHHTPEKDGFIFIGFLRVAEACITNNLVEVKFVGLMVRVKVAIKSKIDFFLLKRVKTG